jgi:outer membrane protein TolC
VQLALATNLGLEIQDLEVKKAKRLVDNTWTVFVPRMTASANLSRVNEVTDTTVVVPVEDSEFPPGSGIYDSVFAVDQEGNRWNLSTSFSMGLELNLLTVFRTIQQTRHGYETGVINLEDARARLRRDVRKQF